ncbi:hypothetical protein [Methylobacter svalbardensis]|uniref:hypothetical protein n=1 Tax=Methylobacter svalbardensis TaxID=3080016 RepID=UPI0030EE76FD
MPRQIERFYPLGQGKKAGRYIGQQDVLCYRPPLSYSATAELKECHPSTGKQFTQSEWWIFLTLEDLS